MSAKNTITSDRPSEPHREPTFKERFAMNAVLGLVLLAGALTFIYFGLDHDLSQNCRDKNNAAQYGIKFCVNPRTDSMR